MYCIACGAPNSDQDRFCNRCGKPLVSGAGASVAAMAAAAAPGVPAMPTTAFRQDDKLVIPAGAPLPRYCLKCAQPVMGEFFKKKFQWHNPLLYLIVLVSPLIYIIVALIVMKRVELMVPMCPEHIQRRKKLLIATWVLALGWIPAGMLVGAATAAISGSDDLATALGLLTFFVLPIAALVTGHKAAIMRPKEISPASATFTGVCDQFLTLLPSR